MTRLETLAHAIQKREGFYPFSRSWRNNNPGNLVWSPFKSGTDGRFARFPNYATGWLGLWWDLWKKCKGETRTGLGPGKTLLDLCEVWAPALDGNDPQAYARDVARAIGVSMLTPLSWFLEDLSQT